MIKSIVLLIILIPSLLLAGQGMGPGPGVKAYVVTGTDVTYTVSTDESGGILPGVNNTKLWGQSWTVEAGKGGPLKNIIFKSANASGAVITCRVGVADDQINMESSYQTGSGTASSIGEVIISFSTGPTLTVGSTYAVACHQDSATATELLVSSTNVYGSGTEYYTTASDWDLTGHDDPIDLYFKYTVNQ